ncbi:hypothetical protein FXF51_06005 [Nonomuraea sp. PA05]|uniref:hypothetical protein n=1 Tax=Nonomuraea sp. PA05 TaxID=2604466 RepID=UPI0011D7A106|nr:hypothetical protein [Nonomuraea sp. PA05]TYB69713.1 hypothetical protein FXF51_06005 [Nonomuraea sp. PA05]
MKVYAAISNYDSYDYDGGYEVVGVFADRVDAEQCELADGVLAFDVLDGPAYVRDRHVVTLYDSLFRGPERTSYRRIDTGNGDTLEEHGWRAVFETFDSGRADAKMAEWQAEHKRRAAEFVASLDRIDVKVWYEPGDGYALVLTPLHLPERALRVSRDLITDQAGMPRGATLHAQWFTVDTLTLDHIDGFKVCRAPAKDGLATLPTATASRASS